MLTYVYQCRDCGRTFEKAMTVSDHEAHQPVPCPHCQSTNTEQKPSAFQAVTSNKS